MRSNVLPRPVTTSGAPAGAFGAARSAREIEDRKRALCVALWLFLGLLLVRLPATRPAELERPSVVLSPISFIDPIDSLPPPPPPPERRAQPEDLVVVVLPDADHEPAPVEEPAPAEPDADVFSDPPSAPRGAPRPPPARAGGRPHVVGQAGLTPPVPLETPAPEHPALESRLGIGGKVRLRILVDADGRVASIDVLSVEPPRESFERAAVEAVGRWRYEPARFEGRAVPAVTTVLVRFRP